MTSVNRRSDEDLYFDFGENWKEFIELLDDERLAAAKTSLVEIYDAKDLSGKAFLDVGCGSGLFSLAARQLGARVVSVDVDEDCIWCTEHLREKYFPEDEDWEIVQGSVIDDEFMERLGTFDLVYCFGVVAHTGDLENGMENLARVVEPGGLLHVAIYNDQGMASRVWRRLKRWYNKSPGPIQWLMAAGTLSWFELKWIVSQTLKLENPSPRRRREQHKASRGMSAWHDAVDWIGSYPHEVAEPEEVFEFYHQRGFELVGLETTGGGHGNNRFTFRKREMEGPSG